MSDAYTDIYRDELIEKSWQNIFGIEKEFFEKHSKDLGDKLLKEYEAHTKLRRGYFSSPNGEYANRAISILDKYLKGDSKYEEVESFLQEKYERKSQ